MPRGEVPGREALEAVIRGDGIHSEFQPIVDLARASVVGYEALARFDGPVRNPLVWFEAARAEGRLAELEAAALRCALQARATLPVNTFLTVNIGPLAIDAPCVREVWGDFPDLGGVVVELTEHERVESYTELDPALDRLRGAGALLAIDDAGAGYAGLQHVLTLRPDVIKLDRALVEGLDRDEAKRTMVEMIGTLAGRLDAWLLAEGIETGEELDVLVGLGVPLAQGFFLARPGPAFPELGAAAAERIITQIRLRDGHGLRPFIEHVPVANNQEQALETLADERVDVVVLLDERRRPAGTVDVGGLTHAVRDSGLKVNIDTTPAQALERAMVRRTGQRFAPLVCIDDAGRYVGVVRIERLVINLCRDH